MPIDLFASPLNTLVDEDVKIKAVGLKPKQKITLTSTIIDERGEIFECFAFYEGDEQGNVNLSQNPSFGGMYEGLEPMGLFWAMEGSKRSKHRHIRLIKRDVTTPLKVTLSAYEGWKNIDELQNLKSLNSTEIFRWYKSLNVKRVPVKQGTIRGTLFIPEGKGPFPPVIDMFGGAGGLFEFRASMLASRGLLTFSLAIFAYDDLPSDLANIRLEYYEEAVEFINNHPRSNHGGVGVIGVSLGGIITMAVGAYVPGVKAAMCLNAGQYGEGVDILYRGYTFKPINFDMTKLAFYGPDSAISERPARIYEDIEKLPPRLLDCYKSDCHFMLLASGDDGAMPMKDIANDFINIRNKFNMDENRWKLKYYPGAGHLLELPNTPSTCIVYFNLWGRYVYYGGRKREHAKAQYDSWNEILQFFKEKLSIKLKL